MFASAVSGWEIAIKKAKGRLVAPDNLAVVVEEKGFGHLPLTFEQAERTAALPSHHRDPFDRMLIGQAQLEGLVSGHPGRPHPVVPPLRDARLTRSQPQESGEPAHGWRADVP